MFDLRGKTSCHFQRSWHNPLLNPLNSHALLSGTVFIVSPFSYTLSFSTLNSWVHPPILSPHYHHHTGCAHYSRFACLLQSRMRRDETELPVAASAELHSSDRKEFHFGPQTQPANKCRLLKGAIRARTQTSTKMYPQTEFTLHSIQFKYIYMHKINWKTEVYLPAHCFSPCRLPIKLSWERWSQKLSYHATHLHSYWAIRHVKPIIMFSYVYVKSLNCYCSQFVRKFKRKKLLYYIVVIITLLLVVSDCCCLDNISSI